MRWYNKNRLSKLYVQVKTFRNLPADMKMHIDYLPQRCLINSKLLVFASGFRHYLAENLLHEDTLHNLRQGNPVIEMFMKILNNPDIMEIFAKHWVSLILNKLSPKEQRPGDILIRRVEDVILKIYPVIYKNDFQYVEAEPNQSAFL